MAVYQRVVDIFALRIATKCWRRPTQLSEGTCGKSCKNGPSKWPFQLGDGNRFCVVLLPNFDHDRLGRIAARVLLLICGTVLVILNLGSKRSPSMQTLLVERLRVSSAVTLLFSAAVNENQGVSIFHQLGSPRTSCVLLAGLQQRSGLFLEDLVWWQAQHRGRLEGNHIFSGRKPVDLVAGYPATIWIIWHSHGKWSSGPVS